MRIRSVLVPLVIAGLILSGCGGGKGNTSTTATSAAGQTSTTLDAALVASDKAYGQKVVLVTSDLPSGWTPSAPQPENAVALEAGDLLNNCTGLPKNSEIRIMKVSGNDFKNGDNSISSDVTSLKTEKLVQQDKAGITNSKNFTCIANVIDAQLAQTLSDGRATSTVAKLPNVASGDNQFALRITTHVTANGGTSTVYSDILGMAYGRYEININVTYVGTPAPSDFEKSLLGAAARHMAAVKG